MRKILIRGKNDRGGEVRLSTHREKLELEVFWLTDGGQIQKGLIELEKNPLSLTIRQDGKEIGFIKGEFADKLACKS